MEPATCIIDGFGPLPVVRSASVAELGKVVRRAATEERAIYPIGGQTQLDLGNPPTKPGTAVDMRGLDQVIDFPARDMTITVQAGITIAKLQALLAPENLRLPIDVPQPERATLGGILATNVSGPRRFGYGTLRDYVIGISAVSSEGSEFKAGGRVVKNVAGYDLCKLLIGSLGTLGIITQVTLKLRPLAEETALVTFDCDTPELARLMDQLHGSRTRPVCLELLNLSAAQAIFDQAQAAVPKSTWVVIVGYEGNTELVNWQVRQLVKELGGSRSLDARVGESARSMWHALIDWLAWTRPQLVVKASLLPSSVPHVCATADALNPRPAIQAHAGNGIVHYAFHDCAPVVEHVPVQFDPGTSIVVKSPTDWKSSVAVWGTPRADQWLMHKVKAQLDPMGVFNPGRFVGGI